MTGSRLVVFPSPCCPAPAMGIIGGIMAGTRAVALAVCEPAPVPGGVRGPGMRAGEEAARPGRIPGGAGGLGEAAAAVGENLLRHFLTVPRSSSKRSASSTLEPPSAAANTIRARNARPAALLRRRVYPSNSARSSSVSTISAAVGDGISHSNKSGRINDSGH
jgi:hypothetical protein